MRRLTILPVLCVLASCAPLDTHPQKAKILIAQGGRWIGNYGRTSHLRASTSEIKLYIDNEQIFDFHLNGYSGNHDLQLDLGQHGYQFRAHIDLPDGAIDDTCRGFIDIQHDAKLEPQIAFDNTSIKSCGLTPLK